MEDKPKRHGLENLQPYNRTGSRNRMTKAYVQTMMDYISETHDEFEADMAELSPKDRVAARIQMLKLLLPKMIDVSGDADVVQWIMQTYSPVTTIASGEPVDVTAEEVVEAEDTFAIEFEDDDDE